jgi:TetR/AcrR family transcriptional regulator, transcriptional repressor for nem operon
MLFYIAITAIQFDIPTHRRPRQLMIISFAQHLKAEIENKGPLKKGQRTKMALRLAIIALLDEVGYHELKLADVCQQANIAPGSFYAYFTDKRELTLSVLDDFLECAYALLFLPEEGPAKTPFEAIYFANLRWIQLVRANSGLMRCLLQLSDQEPDFASRYNTISHRLHLAVGVNVLRRNNGSDDTLPDATLLAYALGSMMDEIVRKLVVHQNAQLIRVMDECQADDQSLAEMLALIWYRSIYNANPELVESRLTRSLIALTS